MSKDFWEKRYENSEFTVPPYDGWLDPYQRLFSDEKASLFELGVGLGPNINHYGSIPASDIHACDFSASAIRTLEQTHPGVHGFIHDMAKPFPYGEGRFEFLVSDFSLHYFSRQVTEGIIREFKRILKKGGYLLLRVNAVGDENFGYGRGEELEPSFFRSEGTCRRYFDTPSLQDFFREWDVMEIEAGRTKKFGLEKAFLAGVFRKRGPT